jgi:diacylglycerol kinase family enzyme
VLPRALGLPRDPLAAARAIAAGRTRTISLGRANGRRFGFAAGVGLDAELIRRMDARGRDEHGKRPGDLTFAWTALQALAAHRVRFEPALEVVGHGRAAFALVANADPYSYVGRLPLRLPRGARIEGGIDLLAPRALRARGLPGAVRYLLTGRTRLPLVLLHDADRIEVQCDDPMPLQLDGEDVGDVTEVVFEAERDAVSVLCGR